MSRNSNEKLVAAEAEASLKGTESLRVLMIRKIMAEQTHFEEPSILQSWKGGSFTTPRQPSNLKKVIGSISPTENIFLSFLTSPSISYILLIPTSSVVHLLLPNSMPSGKFLPLLATQAHLNCLCWEAAQNTKLGARAIRPAIFSEPQVPSLEEYGLYVPYNSKSWLFCHWSNLNPTFQQAFSTLILSSLYCPYCWAHRFRQF